MTARFAFKGASFGSDRVTVTQCPIRGPGLSLSAANIFGFADETVVISDAINITTRMAPSRGSREFAVSLVLGDFTNSVTLGAERLRQTPPAS